MFWLATKNVFFTDRIQEGMAAAVMEGGSFHHFIMLYRDHSLDDDFNIIKDKGSKGHYPFAIWGRVWIGIPGVRKLYTYTMQWEEIDPATKLPVPRDEPTFFIFVASFSYALSVEGAEEKGKRPVDAVAVITVEPTNLFTALFKVESYQSQLRTFATKQMVSLIGANLFDDLISELDDGPQFSTELLTLNEKVPGSAAGVNLSTLIGFKIIQATLYSIGFTGDMAKEFQKANSAKKVAQELAEAAQIEGKGIGDKHREIEGANIEMEKKRLEMINENPQFLEIAKTEMLTEAITNTKLTTLVLGEGALVSITGDKQGGGKS
ncbi:MAG TPA: hypothetical protein PK950_01190 [Candidatus Paceibacterota bacterium]|nr:hypothetical protein [Candidatus Paceibacterota bacterium]